MRTAAQTAMLMAILTLISKGFGFVREMVMANYFGTSYITDAYFMALAIPGIIFAGVLGSVATAYMPVYSKIIEIEGETKSNEFTSSVIKILLVLAIISATLGLIFSKEIVSIFASGFKGETAELTIFFLKITFLYIILSAPTEILEAFLRYRGIFIPQVLFGYIQNIILIITIIISAIFNYYYLALGYLIVNVLRIIIMLAIAKRNNFKYLKKQKINKAVISIIALAVPVFIGNSMSQINAFVDKTLASRLVEGSVAALSYGNLLIGMIMGLTITIMTTILYPKLTQANSQKDDVRLSNITSTGINLTIIIVAPCALGAMLYSKQIVQIVFERGAFDSIATNMTSSAFFYYSIGLMFMSLNAFLNQIYFSKHNMKTPVIFGAIGVIINITLNLILVRTMALSGLALATSISAIIGTLFLYIGIARIYPQIKIIKSKIKIFQILVSAFCSILSSYIIYRLLIMQLDNFTGSRIIQLILAVISAAVIYALLLWIIKIDEIKLLYKTRNKYGN